MLTIEENLTLMQTMGYFAICNTKKWVFCLIVNNAKLGLQKMCDLKAH